MKKSVISFALTIALAVTSFCQTRTWEKMDGPYGTRMITLAVSPNGDLYAAMFMYNNSRHLMRSTDHGDTWLDLPNTPPFFNLYSNYPEIHSIDFGADGKVIMHLGTAIYISSDNGNSWVKTNESAFKLLGKGNADEYFIITTDQKILHSKDGGMHWNDDCAGHHLDGSTIDEPWWNIAWVSDNTFIAYAKGDYHIFISYDDCKSWALAPHQLPTNGEIANVFKVRVDNYIVQNSNHEVFASDLQNPWQLIANSPHNLNTVTTFNNNRIVGLETPIEKNPGIYVSEIGTTVMHRVTPPILIDYYRNNEYAYSTIVSDNLGRIYYQSTDGAFISEDTGETWKELFLPYDNVSYIQIDNSKFIFTKRTGPGGYPDYNYLNQGVNSGKMWSKISPINKKYWGYLGPAFGGGILTTVHDSNTCSKGMDIWYYGGIETQGWAQLSRIVYPAPSTSEICTPGPGFVFFSMTDSLDNLLMGGNNGILYKTENQGVNWDQIATPILASLGAFSPSWDLYIGNRASIVVSKDQGETWSKIKHIGYSDATVMNALIVPNDQIIFVGTNDNGIYRSSDGGNSWVSLGGPWGDSINCLAYTKSGEVFIGTNGKGLFSCDLNGDNAVREPLDIPSNTILSLFVHKGRDVYVGTLGSSLWVSHGPIPSGVADNLVRSKDYQAEILKTADGVTLRITCALPAIFDITLFDALGKEIRSISTKNFSAGTYLIPFDTQALASGAYFIRLTTENDSRMLKFVK